MKIIEANQIFLLLSEYVQSILDCYGGLTQQEAKSVLMSNFPFMEPRIQSLIKTSSEYYGIAPNNPFEDENIRMLFSCLGIARKKKSVRAINDIFRGIEAANNRRQEVNAQAAAGNQANQPEGDAPRQQNQGVQNPAEPERREGPQVDPNRPADRVPAVQMNPINQAVME